VGALVLLAAVTVVTPQGRAAAKTVGFVIQVVPNFPIKPLGWFTGDPVREAVTYPAGSLTAQADEYRIPDGNPRAAVVLFLGVNPAGRDDERVVNLASGLARAGFVVLVPWSENMAANRVDPADIDLLVGAFEYLKSRGYVDPERIGGGGFCVGSSMLLVAAADPRIRDDVAFVNFFSGFFDARDFLAQFATKTSYFGDEREPWDPDSLTERVFTRLLIEGLPDSGEEEALARHFIDGGPLDPAVRASLSDPADAVYRLLTGPSLEETGALIDRLPAGVQQTMTELSPSTYIDDLRADLLIMHDREDDLAPVEESRRLRQAVAGRDNVRYTEFSFFSHVDPGKRVGIFGLIGESIKLYRHLYSVVRIAS
jgi:dienelactone hydrolase